MACWKPCGCACVSALGSTQSLWRTKGKRNKERNCFYESSAFCFSQTSFSAVASAAMVPLEFVPAAPGAAATFVYLFSDAFVRGFASLVSLTLGVAFGTRVVLALCEWTCSGTSGSLSL